MIIKKQGKAGHFSITHALTISQRQLLATCAVDVSNGVKKSEANIILKYCITMQFDTSLRVRFRNLQSLIPKPKG